MNSYFLDVGYVSLNKLGEELCGDKVEYVVNKDGATVVLADGLGSGVKANILATLTSKMLCTMISNGLNIDDCIDTVAKTLPVCKIRNVAYSTFAIININNQGEGTLVEYDTPQAILLKNGKAVDLERERTIVQNKEIFHSKISLNNTDAIIVNSDGVLHAGIGKLLNFGWDRKEVKEFLEKSALPDMSARCLASLVANACDILYQGECGDDTTIAVLKAREELTVDIMVGPPAKREQDEVIIKQFMAGNGKKIVCGGTSSQIVARYLNKEVRVSMEYYDEEIPPIGIIDGIDLVTEGVLTIRKLIEISEKYINPKSSEIKNFKNKDGASKLADMLFERATKVNFFVGRGVNSAHSNLSIDTTVKLLLVDKLSKILEKLGKAVKVLYC